MRSIYEVVIFGLFSLFLVPDVLSTAIVSRNGSDVVGKQIRSHGNREFQVLTYGSVEDRDDSHRFVIIGGTHGDEIMTTEFVAWLYKRTVAGKSPLSRLADDVAIDFIPALNVDNLGKSRYNQNAVNLNRNYSVNWGKSTERFGNSPFSEKETTFIRAMYDTYKYTAAADVHGYVDWIVAPSLPHKMRAYSNHKNTSDYSKWIGALKNNLDRLPSGDYQVVTDLSLNDGGAFEDWSFWKKNTPAFCLELSEKVQNSANEEDFKRYESYIYRMFRTAMHIKESDS